MKTANEIWELVNTHIESQILALSDVDHFFILNPSRGGTSKHNKVGYMYQMGLPKGRYAMGGDRYPSFMMNIEIGLLVADTSQNAHENNLALARGTLIDWFDGWVKTKPWTVDWGSYVDTVGYVDHDRGETQLANGLNDTFITATWVRVPLSCNRR